MTQTVKAISLPISSSLWLAVFAAATIGLASVYLSPAAQAKPIRIPSLFGNADSQVAQRQSGTCANGAMAACVECEQQHDMASCQQCHTTAKESCRKGCTFIEWPQANGEIAPRPCSALLPPTLEPAPPAKASEPHEKAISQDSLEFFSGLSD